MGSAAPFTVAPTDVLADETGASPAAIRKGLRDMRSPLRKTLASTTIAAALSLGATTTTQAAETDPRGSIDATRDGATGVVRDAGLVRREPRGAIYFTTFDNSFVGVLDLDTGLISEIELYESQAESLARDAGSNRLFVTGSSTRIYAIDLATRKKVDEVTWKWDLDGAPAPDVVVADPGDQTITVSAVGSNVLRVLAMDDLSNVVDVDFAPQFATLESMAYSPSGELWATHGELPYVYARDAMAGRGVGVSFPWSSKWSTFAIPYSANVPAPGEPGYQYLEGNTAWGLAFLPAMGLGIVSNKDGYEVSLVDEKTHEVLDTEWAPIYPTLPTAVPGGTADLGRFFLPSPDTNELSVYDVRRMSNGTPVIGYVWGWQFQACKRPQQVIFADNDPDTAWVVCSDAIVGLDPQTFKEKRRFDLPYYVNPMHGVWAAR